MTLKDENVLDGLDQEQDSLALLQNDEIVLK
jgi:hypothetical protein